ncbi:DUF3967 domain-containing protein [Bacillus thuringiensis]|nr:DUF3967 domain-containing protein [Bacillus thuringiensis]
MTIRKLIEIKSHPDMTLKQACGAIMTWIKRKSMSEVDTDVIRENKQHDESYEELKQMIQQQNELLKQMSKKMDEQQRYIDEKLEKRDQQLISAIRDIQVEKRILLETTATKKKWWQFWSNETASVSFFLATPPFINGKSMIFCIFWYNLLKLNINIC